MSQALHFDVGRGCTCQRPIGWSHRQFNAFWRLLQNVARIVYGGMKQSRERRAKAMLELDARTVDVNGLSRDAASCETAKLFRRSYAQRHMK